jgi:DNA/RNA endonuclease YhcR with UshA esterase domain
MRIAWIGLAAALVATSAQAAVIPAAEASAHVSQSETVEGVVSEVHTARSGKATFIDIGGRYPNESFTAVIFESNMAAVGDVSGLTGKTVDVTGVIKEYQGRPEVIVTSRSQIRTN